MSDNENSQDPLAFMKKMWSSMGITVPGMIIPTMDPNELEKRIKDLRAVEGWLRMNLNMLSASINTLEVQRATLATLKSFAQAAKPGEKASDSVGPKASEKASNKSTDKASEKASNTTTDKANGQAGETVEPNANPFVTPSMWPWNLIQQVADPGMPESPPRKPEGGDH